LESKINAEKKKDISQITQISLDEISKTFKKFNDYKNVHKTLRQIRLKNEPLPANSE
jgi:inorganic pyrophosphatase